MIDKYKMYEIIFWISMSTVLVWMILKGVGIINTPVFVQLIPYAGGVFAFGVFFQMVKGLKDEVKEVKVDVRDLKSEMSHVKIDVSQIKTRLGHVENGLSHVENRLGNVERIVHKLV